MEESPKDVPKKNRDIVKENTSTNLAELQKKKSEVDLVNGRIKTYIRDKVYEHRKDWWRAWSEMLESPDPKEKRAALVEYNKLQSRILPTQLEGSGNSNVQVNIMNGMGIDTDPNNKDEPVEAQVIE